MLTAVDASLDRDAARARRAEAVAETGRFTVAEIMAANASAERSPAYVPTKPAEILAGIDGAEREHWAISLGRLRMDARRAVARYAPRFRKENAEALVAETVALIVRWPMHGEDSFDLGARIPLSLGRAAARAEENRRRAAGDPRARAIAVTRWIDRAEEIVSAGSLPPRRAWILSDESPREISKRAWRVLHAAVKQASETRDMWTTLETEKTEIPSSDGVDFDALVESDRAARGTLSAMPDVESPEILARMLSVSLDAARAAISAAYPGVSHADLGADWSLSADSVKKALGRGRKALRATYPELSDLLSAIDRAADQWLLTRADVAAMAIDEFSSGVGCEETARVAVNEWRGARNGMAPHRLALLAAARAAMARQGDDYGSARAELIAASVARLIPAEEKRARRVAAVSLQGTPARGATYGDAPRGESRDYARRTAAETPYARRWTYGLTARDARAIDLSSASPAPEREAETRDRARRAEARAATEARAAAWADRWRAAERARVGVRKPIVRASRPTN